MTRLQMLEIIQYINEVTANRRDFEVIGRLQHSLLDSCEPDEPCVPTESVEWKYKYIPNPQDLSRGTATGYFWIYRTNKPNEYIARCPTQATAVSICEHVEEYYKLQKHHATLKASYDAVVVKVRKLQQMVAPAVPQPFDPNAPIGPDWNSIVHAINNLFPVKL